MTHQPPKLLDQVRCTLRTKHYSIRTEEAYLNWIKRFILFHHKQHPQTLNSPEIEAFLTHLAVEGQVAAATQDQALAALLFLYREVLRLELAYPSDRLKISSPQVPTSSQGTKGTGRNSKREVISGRLL